MMRSVFWRVALTAVQRMGWSGIRPEKKIHQETLVEIQARKYDSLDCVSGSVAEKKRANFRRIKKQDYKKVVMDCQKSLQERGEFKYVSG